MITVRWAEGHGQFPQVEFRRLFRSIKRSVPAAAEMVTAYTDGSVTLRSNRRRDGYHEAADMSGMQGVRVGDFVIHGLDILRGSVGISDSEGAISSVCVVCEPIGEADPRYFTWVIRAQASSGFPRALARGIREGGADFRRWGTLAELPVPCPQVAQQRAIADYLDIETGRIDALITKKRRMIELLEERVGSLIDEKLLAGAIRGYVGQEPADPVDGAWEKLPAGWHIVPLKHLVNHLNSGAWGEEPGENEIEMPVATTAQISSDGQFDVCGMARRSFSKPEVVKYACRPGDIVVVKSSGSATSIISGKAGLVGDDDKTFVFSNFLMNLRPNETCVRIEMWSNRGTCTCA